MNPYILLAKGAVEKYLQQGKIMSLPENLSAEFLNRRAGIFVTITKDKEPRGCIGTYLPVRENVAQETVYNAIAAATEDFRFLPIQADELPYLTYSVSILSEPTPIKNTSELNPKKFGIIVKTGTKTGLLLPDLPGVETLEKQIAIACQKAGIDPEIEKISIYKFTVEKYE